jgi:hypothetical protein
MNRWTATAIGACIFALGCALGQTQSTNESALKTRLDQVASSYTSGNAFMGTVLVVDGDRVLLDVEV